MIFYIIPSILVVFTLSNNTVYSQLQDCGDEVIDCFVLFVYCKKVMKVVRYCSCHIPGENTSMYFPKGRAYK